MSNIAIFKTNKTPQYLKSVNTPDYDSDPDVLVNPDVSALDSVPLKYWKRNGNQVVEMTPTEKDALGAAELQSKKDSIVEMGQSGLTEVMTALLKVINIRLPAGQKITKAEMITAIKEEIV